MRALETLIKKFNNKYRMYSNCIYYNPAGVSHVVATNGHIMLMKPTDLGSEEKAFNPITGKNDIDGLTDWKTRCDYVRILNDAGRGNDVKILSYEIFKRNKIKLIFLNFDNDESICYNFDYIKLIMEHFNGRLPETVRIDQHTPTTRAIFFSDGQREAVVMPMKEDKTNADNVLLESGDISNLSANIKSVTVVYIIKDSATGDVMAIYKKESCAKKYIAASSSTTLKILPMVLK